MPSPSSRPALARLISVLGIAIGVAGVAFVIKTLVSKWDEVSNAFSQVNAINLALSLLLGLAAMTSIGWIWVTMIIARSHNVRHRNAMAWYFTGQLGKYVPGGIWPIVGRAELAVRNGIPRRDAYASTGLSLVTTYAAAVVAIAIGAVSTSGHRLIAVLIAFGLVTAYIAFAQPSLRSVIIRIASRVSSSASSLTDPKRVVRLTVLHVPAWILMSLSTSVTATAFGAHIGIADMLFITTTSWLAGFVVVGVPGGIGVREAVFTSLAGGIIGTPMAVSLALMSRVVFIAVDLTGALVSSVISRLNSSAKS
ncbi:MAG: lysylphosphatidylglycerol synthase domain-containing protein [Ilumatobacteraceae bacterium]